MKETRFIKWKNYRDEILDNANIDESIINGDKNLKEIISSIKSFDRDFSVAKLSGQKNQEKNKKNKSFVQKQEENEINSLLNEITKNENFKIINNSKNNDYNLHKYDDVINELFNEFLPKPEETTEIKINKVDLSKK